MTTIREKAQVTEKIQHRRKTKLGGAKDDGSETVCGELTPVDEAKREGQKKRQPARGTV